MTKRVDTARTSGEPDRSLEDALLARLAEQPHLGMDLGQFAVVTGLGPDWMEINRPGVEYIRESVRAQHSLRHATLSPRMKKLETRLGNGLAYYLYGMPDGKASLNQVIDSLTGHGYRHVPHIHILTVMHLNSALTHYGLRKVEFFASPRTRQLAHEKLEPYVPFKLDLSNCKRQY